jgi:putative tricarboxylic transport membrane protein
MGLLAAYGLALERLGFVLTTVLLILVWLRGLEGSRWREAITLAVAATVAVYGIFVRWLQVPVPMGVLGR